jgi:hypothetical protein
MGIKFGDLELATKTDVAVAGLAYVATFAADAFFFSGGVTSHEAGLAGAIGALGAKYALQGFISMVIKKTNR